MSEHSERETVALRGQEQFEAAWWAMATFDVEGTILEINRRFAELLELTAPDILERSIFDLVPEEALGPELDAILRLFAGETKIEKYHRRMRLLTGYVWEGDVQLSLVRDDDNEPTQFHLRMTEGDGPRRPPAAIAGREGDLRLALDQMRVGVAVMGLDGRALEVNQALCDITGRTKDELITIDLLAITHPDDLDEDIRLGTLAWQGELDSYTIEKRLVRPDGTPVWVLQEVTLARDEAGNLVQLIGQLVDIDDRKQAELELARSREQYSDLVERMPIGILQSDGNGVIVTANPAAAAIAGLPEIGPGFDMARVIHPGDLSILSDTIASHVAAGTDFHVEFRVVRPDGSIRWVRNDAHPDVGPDGTFNGLTGTWLDITTVRAADTVLRRQAGEDQLTGLGNRRRLFHHLQEEVTLAYERGRGPSVLFVDLDGFKAVNDTHGHRTGDQVLVEVARRLKAILHPDDVPARIGGDEFVIVVPPPEPTDGSRPSRVWLDPWPEELAELICDAFDDPLGDLADVGASVGIAHWQPGMRADDLVNAADRAVYQAKRDGRGCWRRFDPNLSPA